MNGQTRGVLAKLFNLVIVFTIHVVVAPVAAAVGFVGLLLAWASHAQLAHPPEILAVGAVLAVGFSFAAALAPAALMGVACALWQTFVGRVSALGTACGGLVLGAATWAAVADELGLVDGGGSPVFALCLLTGLVAALCAWLPARSFVTAADAR